MPLYNPQGYEFLASTVFGSSLQTSGAIAIEARDLLLVQVRITGYSGADIASLQFNGDTAGNYWSRYITWAAGAATPLNQQNTAVGMARLFGLTSTLQRSAVVGITNLASKSKVGTVSGQTSTGAAATAGFVEHGGFEWVNTSAQITSITLMTAGGSITMPTGTGFAVYGRNL